MVLANRRKFIIQMGVQDFELSSSSDFHHNLRAIYIIDTFRSLFSTDFMIYVTNQDEENENKFILTCYIYNTLTNKTKELEVQG